MTTNPPREFRTDAIRPSAIQSGTLGRRTGPQLPNAGPDEDDAAGALEKEYQRWNTRIDTEMVALSSGLRELIQFANISPNPPPHIHQTTPLQLKVTTSQIIRSTQNLRDIAHDLKLALLLSNQVDTTEKRDAEMRLVRDAIVQARRKVGEGIVGLLNGDSAPAPGGRNGAAGSDDLHEMDRDGIAEEQPGAAQVEVDAAEDSQMEPPAAADRTENAKSPAAAEPPTRSTPPVGEITSPTNDASRPPDEPDLPRPAVEDDSDDEEMEEV